MTNYQKILETASLVLVADDNSPAYQVILGEALASLSREEMMLVLLAQKLLDKGAYCVSTDNPSGYGEMRKLAEYMGATVTESKSRPWFLPDDLLWREQTTLMFRMPSSAG